MLNFLTLTLTPNSLIALNKDLKVPKSFEIKLNAKPSLFDYPEFLKKDSDKKKEKVETAVLSTTAKVKAREQKKKKNEEGADADMSEPLNATPEKNDKSAAAADSSAGK